MCGGYVQYLCETKNFPTCAETRGPSLAPLPESHGAAFMKALGARSLCFCTAFW